MPKKYMMYLTGVLLTLLLLVILLVWNFHKRIRFFIGIVLAALITVVFMASGFYVQKTSETLGNISSVKTEISQVAVFVKAEDSAKSIADARGYVFGILEFLDRENTDKIIEEINGELEQDIKLKTYAGPGELLDGIWQEEVGAIIINQAYLEIADEMEGYEGYIEKLRLLDMRHVETVKEVIISPKAGLKTANVKTSDAEVSDTEISDTEISDTEISDTEISGIEISEIENVDTEIADGQGLDAEVSNVELSKNEGEIISVYISGIDTYGDVSAKSRSDVNIIATVNTGTKQVLLVSTPRDYFVPLSISNGVPDKLTHAGIYGIDVSKDTLAMLYEIEIPYYFRVNFSGFSGIIDALGGITVHSDYDFTAAGFSFHVGENHLNGTQALAFARERYSFSAGDRQRGKNQMAVIKAVLQKAVSADLLKNFSSILNAVEGTFETSIPMSVITSLINAQLDEGGEWNIVMYSVDGTGDKQKPYSMSQNAYVMIPDQTTVDKAKELIRQVKDGETLSLDE